MAQRALDDKLDSAIRITEILAVGMGILSALVLVVFGLVLIGGVHLFYKAGWVSSERIIAISFSTLLLGLLCGFTCTALSWAAQKGSLRLLARNSVLAMIAIAVVVSIQILMSLSGVALVWWQGSSLFSLIIMAPLVAAGRGWRNRLVGFAAFIGAGLIEVTFVLLVFARPVSIYR